MASKRCRLYDENLVHNIMRSTGLSVLEYLRRENRDANHDEICYFIESHAELIVNDTIDHLSGIAGEQEPTGGFDGDSAEDGENSGEGSDEWPKL